MAATSDQVKTFLNKYLFEHIWNEPLAEYRRVMEATPVKTRSVIGSCPLIHDYVSLPTTNTHYFLYQVQGLSLSGIDIDADDWTTLEELCASDEKSLMLYTEYGEVFYRGKVWVRWHTQNVRNGWANGRRGNLLVAVDKSMLKVVAGAYAGAAPSVYLGAYVDSTEPYDTDASQFNVTSTTIRATAYASCQTADVIFINGREVASVDAITDIAIGDYVETIDDGNIMAEFTQNPFADDAPFYPSDVADEDAYIIHIPKAQNEWFRMITHNTCDVFVRPHSGAPGLFLHRAWSTEKSFIQLTHSDFAIPKSSLDKFEDYLGETFDLHVIVRAYTSDNYMPRDVNYIDLLYLHTDEEIMNFMADIDNSSPMDFWKAEHLEASKYVDFMFQGWDYPTKFEIEDVVAALGYYQTLSLLYPKVWRYELVNGYTRDFTTPVPLLTEGEDLVPHVFINGLKVHDDDVDYSYIENTRMNVALESTIAVAEGDSLIIELNEDPQNSSYLFEPESGAAYIDIPYAEDEMLIYKVISISPGSVTGFHVNSSTIYRAVTVSSIGQLQDQTTYYRLVVGAASYGDTFVIQPKSAFYKFDDLSCIDDDHGVLHTSLTVDLEDTTTTAPLLGSFSTAVYLNGRALVENIDFTVIQHEIDEAYSHTQLIIHNVEYLQASGNFIEAYVSRGRTITAHTGYPTSNNITGMEDMFVWFPSLAMAYNDGYMMTEVSVRNGVFRTSDIVSQYGTLSGARFFIINEMDEYLSAEAQDLDTERITDLRDYFASLAATTQVNVVAPKAHRIYSSWMAMVTWYLLDVYGEYDDATDINRAEAIRAAKEFAERYRVHDVVYTDVPNFRYIDIHPTWYHPVIVNRELHRILQVFAKNEIAALESITNRETLRP